MNLKPLSTLLAFFGFASFAQADPLAVPGFSRRNSGLSVAITGQIFRLMFVAAVFAAVCGTVIGEESQLETRKWTTDRSKLNGTLHAYDPERKFVVIKEIDPGISEAVYSIWSTTVLDPESKDYLQQVPREKIPAGTGWPASADILGIKIGMTHAECIKILEAQGFPQKGMHQQFSKSAEEQVRAAIAYVRGEKSVPDKDAHKVPISVQARRQEGQSNAARADSIEIKFLEDVSSSPRVSRAVKISYSSGLQNRATASDGVWIEETRAMLVKKYGPAALEMGKVKLFWCSGNSKVEMYGDSPPKESKGWRKLEVTTDSLASFSIKLIDGDTFLDMNTKLKNYLEEGKKKTDLPRPNAPKL